MESESSVREAERRLRDVVNRPPVQDRLMKDSRHWSQLCSSMDVIGDTEMAVTAYLGSRAHDEDRGQLYLRAYGLLQVLFVQQDAVKHAAEAIELDYSPPASLGLIREIRNDEATTPLASRAARYSRDRLVPASSTTAARRLRTSKLIA